MYRLIFCAVVTACLTTSCGSTKQTGTSMHFKTESMAMQKGGLADLASKVRPGFLVGAHINHTMQKDWKKLPEAQKILKTEFNSVSTGIYQKSIQKRGRNDWFFNQVDRNIDFAQKNQMVVYAHPLFGSNGYIPDWMLNEELSDDELLQIVEDRIKTILTRYKGKIHIVDVYNEGLDRKTGAWRSESHNFMNRLGMRKTKHGTWPIVLEKMFIWSRKYGGDDIKLIYNDNFNTQSGLGQSDGSIALFKGLKAAGIPIDGIGIQAHMGINKKGEFRLTSSGKGPLYDEGLFRSNLQEMGEAGAEVYISETDIHLYTEANPEILQKQADGYRSMFKACIEQPACKMFKTWGFHDSFGWVVNKDNPEPKAHFFDVKNAPKPAYFAIRQLLLEMLEK